MSASCWVGTVMPLAPANSPDIGAKRLDFRVGVGDLDAQFLDFLRQPGARRLRLVLLGVLLLGQIELRPRCWRRARPDAGSVLTNSICSTRDLATGNTVRRVRNASTTRSSAELAPRPPVRKRPRERQRIAGVRRIEFGPIEQAELVGRLAREFRGGDRFGLALHAFGIDDGARLGGRLVGPGEIALLVLQQHLGDAGVARADRRHEDARERSTRPASGTTIHCLRRSSARHRRARSMASPRSARAPPCSNPSPSIGRSDSADAPELLSFMRD